MRKYHTVKIVVKGHVMSGKSTYAQLIADMLSENGFPVEVRDDKKTKRISASLMRKRINNMPKFLKNNMEKVIIETQQAKREEEIV